MVARLLLVHRPEVEDRALAGEPVGLLLLPPADGLLEHLEHALARPGQRTALHERFEHALVRDHRVDALGEVPDRLERAALVARGDQRLRSALADALDGVQPEPDLAVDDREVDLRLVHVRRQHLDAELVARVDVDRHAVLRRHHGADERRHVLARVVLAQPGGLVGDQRVTRRVRLRERVVGRLLDVLPQLLRGRRRHVLLRGAVHELVLQRLHERADLLADRLAQVVGLGDREAGELAARCACTAPGRHANPVRILQDRLQPRVDVGDLLPGRSCACRSSGCTPSGPAGRARRARSDPRTPSASPDAVPRACLTTRTGRRRRRRPSRASRRSSCRPAGSSRCRGRR